ncbi:MAG: tetratricopeptide repeat protein [Planctomycetales bacterium]|nr:tetratricopeptide repeat protein [Planctomycetales bacterium]
MLLGCMLLAVVVGFALLRQYSNQQRQATLEQLSALVAQQPDQAEETLRAMLNETPDSAEVRQLVFQCLYGQGKYEEAAEFAVDWVNRSGESYEAHYALAKTRHALAQLPAATESMRTAMHLSPNADARREIGVELLGMLIEAEDTSAARTQFEYLRTIGADGRVPKLQLAYLLRLEGRFEDARRLLGEVLDASPDSVAAKMLLGVVHLDLGEYELAAKQLAEVVADQPENKEAHFKLALALGRLGRTSEAARHFAINQRLVQASQAVLERRGDKDEAVRREE